EPDRAPTSPRGSSGRPRGAAGAPSPSPGRHHGVVADQRPKQRGSRSGAADGPLLYRELVSLPRPLHPLKNCWYSPLSPRGIVTTAIADLKFVLLASVMALALAPAAEADTAQVEILDFGFVPDEITAAAAGELPW